MTNKQGRYIMDFYKNDNTGFVFAPITFRLDIGVINIKLEMTKSPKFSFCLLKCSQKNQLLDILFLL